MKNAIITSWMGLCTQQACLLFSSAEIPFADKQKEDTGSVVEDTSMSTDTSVDIVEDTAQDTSETDSATEIEDKDQDGVVATEDCNDNNPVLLAIQEDTDCDGIKNSEDICPNDFWNDLDQDGICGDVDSICDLNLVIDATTSSVFIDMIATQCVSLVGSITIQDGAEPKAEWFAKLQSIKGDIHIQTVPSIRVLQGFPILEDIAGELVIIDNENLYAVYGFSALMHVSTLVVKANPNWCFENKQPWLAGISADDVVDDGTGIYCQ
jgi:hypothetical protein